MPDLLLSPRLFDVRRSVFDAEGGFRGANVREVTDRFAGDCRAVRSSAGYRMVRVFRESIMGRIAALLILSCVPVLAQSTSNRATIQQSLGFEDQTGPSLTGWFTNPPDTVAVDDTVAHSGRWSVRLDRDAKSTGTFSVIRRILPVDFQGQRIEVRGYLKLKDVSGFAGLWLREDSDGAMLAIENMQSQQVKGTRDWAEYRIQLPLQTAAQEIYFGVLV